MSDILNVIDIHKYFRVDQGMFKKPLSFHALKGISLSIEKGATFGLIGESGSGKSTLGRVVANLLTADQGQLVFKDQVYDPSSDFASADFRNTLQIVFQMASNPLDPLRTIEQLLADPLKLSHLLPVTEFDKEIDRLLGLVQLPKTYRSRFPLQLSGGERQRICIARALATRPEFLILDEPVSALDVSVQGQIMNLLLELKKEMNLTYLFITHDLHLANKFCTHIGVMKNGVIVEQGAVKHILQNPQHDYTKQLLGTKIFL